MLITDSAVRETAATLAQSLGEDWTLDPDAPADGAAHLIYSDGRAISFRPIFGGATAQLWITGNAASALPDNATPAEHAAHEARIATRLPEGHRYNMATTLVTEDEEEPAVIILRTLRDHLLPAFEYKPLYVGHRPWAELFEEALEALNDDPFTNPGTSLRDCGPEAHTRPHGEDVEPENGDEPEAQPEPDPEAEANPEAEPQRTASDADGDSTTPAEKSSPELGHQQPDTASEAAPAKGDAGEISEPAVTAATRRPRKRPTKRRPKPSTT